MHSGDIEYSVDGTRYVGHLAVPEPTDLRSWTAMADFLAEVLGPV